MTDAPILTCRGVGRVFTTYRRAPGLRGVLRNFFNRETVRITALRDIDLEVHPGDFVGLIGANGAGKTTLVKCLTGIIPVTSGESRLFGCDSFRLGDEHKRRLSLVMGQRSQLWWDLPPLDSFKLLKEIYQVDSTATSRRASMPSRSGSSVAEKLRIQLRRLSLGERMKMEIIGAFLHAPEVVFLDEPTIGLDLVSREEIRRFLIEVNREARATIVLTSHDMEDIEDTCRRLVILNEGRILYDGDLVSLLHTVVGERSVEVHLSHSSRPWSAELEADLSRFGAKLEKAMPPTLTFSVPSDRSQAFIQHLFDLFEVRDLSIEPQPLEHLIREVFKSRKLDVGTSRAPGEAQG